MSEQRVVVMGLGNLLWADEGFGVRVAERLYAHYHWPDEVEIVDGGTQGLNLLGYVESASHLLILDAIDYGLEPGTLRTYAGERIPAYLSAKKMSLHQNSFSEVLALADIRGHLPAHIALVGLQPAMLDDYGGSLSELAREQLPAAEQAALVSDFCEQSAKKGALVFVDPIMGDEGKLYNGVGEETVAHMRKMVAVADCIVPNYTEAAYLADMPYHEDMTEEEARALTIRLHEMGAKSVVVTSAKVDGENCVVGYDGTEGEFFRIPFDLIPVRFVGTGDIFAAVMLGWLVDGVPLQESTHRAMDAVRTMIDRNRDKEDKYLGIPIETCLEVLDE